MERQRFTAEFKRKAIRLMRMLGWPAAVLRARWHSPRNLYRFCEFTNTSILAKSRGSEASDIICSDSKTHELAR